ncbi:MAG: restriction endonuclease [Halobacteriota archaeon]|jgi:hypothetical protein
MSKKSSPKNKADVSSTQKGLDYEDDLQKVYESMLKQKLVDAKVEKRVNLIDSEGGSHEIDLYWKFTLGSVQHQVAVQARNYASKIKKGDLIEFHKILELLPGQPVGLFITRTGYQSGALEYADKHGITLLTFRKPSDYGPEKKPVPDVIATLTVTETQYNCSVTLHLDLDSINKEKQRPITEEDLELAKSLVEGNKNNLDFYDEEGRVVNDFQRVKRILYPELARNPYVEDLVGRTFEFATPTFVLTREPKIPQLKINAITIKRIGKKSSYELEITADSIIKGILEELKTGNKTGNVYVFNNQFKSDGSFTFRFKVSDSGEFSLP